MKSQLFSGISLMQVVVLLIVVGVLFWRIYPSIVEKLFTSQEQSSPPMTPRRIEREKMMQKRLDQGTSPSLITR